MSIKIYRNKARNGRPEFQNTHENEQFTKLMKLLIEKYGAQREPCVLIPNLCDCDAVFVKQDAMIILEFKHYGGSITMEYDDMYADPDDRDNKYISDTEKKWLIDGVEVKGGAPNAKGVPKNPFKQCRINKQNLGYRLKRFYDRPNASVGLIAAVVVFDNDIQFNQNDISQKAQTWFKITDMNHVVDTLDNITHKPDEFHYSEEDILELPGAFKLAKEQLVFPMGKKVLCTTISDMDYQLFIDGLKRFWCQSPNKEAQITNYPADKPISLPMTPGGVYLFKFQSISNPECLASKVYKIEKPTQIEVSLRKVEKDLGSLVRLTGEISNTPLSFNIAGVSFEMCCIKGPACNDGQSVGDFMLAKYAVTKRLWNAVAQVGKLPLCNAATDDTPVTDVSWEQCMAFIKTLNTLSNDMFRLPSAAEWRYAAREGNQDQHSVYAGSQDPTKVAWFKFNAEGVKPVGMLAPNSLQLYDMCGNVWEYCSDMGFDNPEARVACGGSWNSLLDECKIESRAFFHKDYGNHITGFRLAMTRMSSTPIK